MSKLFFALSPEKKVRQQIIKHQNQLLQNRTFNGRMTKEANIHLTIVYLGKLSINQQQTMINCVDELKASPFLLQLDHMGNFKHNKITWMGLTHIPEPLVTLHKQLTICGEHLDLALDKRHFKPHITLARKFNLDKKTQITPINWPIKQFVLYESKQQHDGVNYSVVKTFKLCQSVNKEG